MKLNKPIIFDFSIFIISMIAFIINFMVFKSIIGIFYFTIYGNLLCIIYYFISLVYDLKNKPNVFLKYKGMILTFLLSTFLIYNLYLVPFGQMNDYNGHFIASLLIHVICPLLVISDNVVNIGIKYKIKDILIWSLGIFIYGIIVVTYQLTGGLFLNNSMYPYIIYDYIDYGIIGCILMNFIVYIFFVITSYIIIRINNSRHKED